MQRCSRKVEPLMSSESSVGSVDVVARAVDRLTAFHRVHSHADAADQAAAMTSFLRAFGLSQDDIDRVWRLAVSMGGDEAWYREISATVFGLALAEAIDERDGRPLRPVREV